jgi:hypothetical protein
LLFKVPGGKSCVYPSADDMQKHILTLMLALLVLRAAATAADEAPIMFERNHFADLGNVVDVQGSRTEASTSADPSREVIWCYQEARVCSAGTVSAHGKVVSVWTAIPFPIKLWAPNRIIAERELVCGLHETWLIDRLKKTAEYFGASCLTHQAYHWTIQAALFKAPDPAELAKRYGAEGRR